ncbi:hypothetical protein LCGC14_0958820 [marine sediment metagenome]|uniref:Inner membrane protein YgaP-like transmembrane domain-containing protein n=1 Tax=marine sediment metagenome TaxID=412755 RepID=A0A0F9P160_9ZZZZ|nr:DUF2892 domain-containing protein [Methylophaga aminisulfidivorans]
MGIRIIVKKNLASWDRWCRIIAGTTIIGIAIYQQNLWWLLGLALLINGLSGRCGAYALLGISTAKTTCDIPDSKMTQDKREDD